MKSALRLFASIAGLVLVASCSDDPVSTGASYVTPTYHATVQSIDGRFASVCGAGSKDLYALGPAFLHYDGSHWGTIEPPLQNYGDYRSAIGFPDGELVISDGSRTFVRRNATWIDISDDGFYNDGMWGSASDNLYVVSHKLRHFDGTTWSTVALPEENMGIYSIAGRAADDIVISATDGKLLRYDGTQWTETQIDSFVSYRSMAITESGRTFGSGYSSVYELTGSTPRTILQGIISNPMLCADHEVLYVAGRLSYDSRYFVIARYENNGWQNVALDSGRLNNLWAGGGNVIAAGSENFIWRGTATGGSKETVYPQRGPLVCARNIDGAVFVAGEGAYRYDDGKWTDLNKEYTTRNNAWDIAGRTRYDIYAVGNEMVLHYDGSTWTWVNSGFNQFLNAVWVDGTGDVWIAPDNIGLYRLHGNTWSQVTIPDTDEYVLDLWGSDETMFAVGTDGLTAIHKDGVWRQIPSHTSARLGSLWGYDENHVYAASINSNQIFYYNGRSWQPMDVENSTAGLRAIWGASPADLFVMDGNGTLIHYDGRTWQPLERVFSDGMSAVSGSGRDVLAVGFSGSVAYRR